MVPLPTVRYGYNTYLQENIVGAKIWELGWYRMRPAVQILKVHRTVPVPSVPTTQHPLHADGTLIGGNLGSHIFMDSDYDVPSF